MGLSARERLLRTISFDTVDHLPFCFLKFEALRDQCDTEEEFVRQQLELGVDPLVWLPELVWGPDPGVETEVRQEPGDPHPILHKRFKTPKGTLEAACPKTDDWPHGDDIPLMSDYAVARSTRFPVNDEADLDPLEWMLTGPDETMLAGWRREAGGLKALAEKHGVATKAGGTRLADTVAWLCGAEQVGLLGLEKPDLLRRLLDIIFRWHLKGMEVVLDARPDLYWHGEWYGTPFLSPAIFDEFYAPVLKKYVELAHDHGASFCYIGTANMMPFLGRLGAVGVDVIYGIDPLQGDWDFPGAKSACGQDVALWGGVNAYLTVVDGMPEDVEQATRAALETLAAGGGFILSPVDDTKLRAADAGSEYASWDHVRANVRRMVEVWKETR